MELQKVIGNSWKFRSISFQPVPDSVGVPNHNPSFANPIKFLSALFSQLFLANPVYLLSVGPVDVRFECVWRMLQSFFAGNFEFGDFLQ